MSKISLRRYTSLAALITILRKRSITLLDPSSWDDRNDSFYLENYRKQMNHAKIFALCFCESPETYHHWRVFTEGSSGVCILFHYDQFLSIVNKNQNVRADSVKYRTIKELTSNPPSNEDLPFLKRIAFEPEKEFRIIYSSNKASLESFNIPINLECIARISLSPWMHPELTKQVKALLKTIEGCDMLEIYRSTLVENEKWKALGGET